MALSQINYELIFSLPYAHPVDGAVEGKFITMSAPSVRHLSHIAPLKQAFTTAITEMHERSSSEEPVGTDSSGEIASPQEEESLDGSSIISILESSSVDMSGFTDNFKNMILKTNLFKLDGETQVKEALLSKLSVDDFYGMLGDYMVNFILVSLLKKMKDD